MVSTCFVFQVCPGAYLFFVFGRWTGHRFRIELRCGVECLFRLSCGHLAMAFVALPRQSVYKEKSGTGIVIINR